MNDRLAPGEKLRQLREGLGLTVRDVETASNRLASKYGVPDFALSISRISDFETKGTVPSIHKLYSMSVIYRTNLRELLALYRVPANEVEDSSLVEITKTHLTGLKGPNTVVEMPVRLDPAFDAKTTTALSRMIVRWGEVPVSHLARFKQRDYSYGYVGTEDRTMYPLIPPGSFIQIDESQSKIVEGSWRSEYERPIYFIEMRDGFACCWCDKNGQDLVLQPHPLSGCKPRVARDGRDAEVLGRVVGVAMRLGASE